MPVNLNENNNLSTLGLINEVTPIEKESSLITESKSNDIQPNDNLKGLSSLEKRDPNSISVTVTDPNTPLIVLFGPPSCGKTMTLVRLTRYLKKTLYTIQPIRSFRPTSDTNYADICSNFDIMINNDNAAESNERINFMLIEVLKNGKPLCQILEAPGEYYFDPKNPKAPFPNYVNTIINSNNRKVWTIIVEPDWLDNIDRKNYVTKITNLTRFMKPKDKVIFLFNKVDKSNFIIHFGKINVSEAIKAVMNWYPNIFVPFLNQNPISKIWRKYNCGFVPFQTGTYTETENNKLTFQEGSQEYCEHLWSVLLKKIIG